MVSPDKNRIIKTRKHVAFFNELAREYQNAKRYEDAFFYYTEGMRVLACLEEEEEKHFKDSPGPYYEFMKNASYSFVFDSKRRLVGGLCQTITISNHFGMNMMHENNPTHDILAVVLLFNMAMLQRDQFRFHDARLYLDLALHLCLDENNKFKYSLLRKPMTIYYTMSVLDALAQIHLSIAQKSNHFETHLSNVEYSLYYSLEACTLGRETLGAQSCLYGWALVSLGSCLVHCGSLQLGELAYNEASCILNCPTIWNMNVLSKLITSPAHAGAA